MQYDDDLVDIRTAGEILGGFETPLAPSTIYRAIKAGRLPAPIKISAGTSRWRRSELIAVVRAAAAKRGDA